MKKTFTQLNKWALALALAGISTSAFAQRVSTFEGLTLASDSKYIGALDKKGFYEGDVFFPNSYAESNLGPYWSGWAYSNQKDVTTNSYTNDCSSITGGGNNGSKNFGVLYGDGTRLHLTGLLKGAQLNSFYITNNTYAALTIKNGDGYGYSKKFGGATGNDADYFKLSINAYYNGTKTTTPVDFYLADYRFEDNSKDYVVTEWKYVDLSSLGYADSLEFSFTSTDVGEYGSNTPAYFCMDDFKVIPAPFAPKAGDAGSTAIKADDAKFVNWAKGATVTRGLQKIGLLSGGYATVGTESNVIGKADNSVISLGDGGYAVITFNKPIANGPGADFAVFENGFAYNFLELAFVEVSSDGENFFRFPATSYTDTTAQTDGFGYTDPKSLNNLAGKYQVDYGTPFDLEELKNTTGLDVNNITHVKVIDVVGAIDKDYATRDQYNQIVNDPWPTQFGSGGFDLDAVGVINESSTTSLNDPTASDLVNVYPNPAKSGETVTIGNTSGYVTFELLNSLGEAVASGTTTEVSLSGLTPGLYFLNVTTDNGTLKGKKLIVK